MEAIMAMGLGERLNVVGFFFSFVGGLMALVGAALMFLGSNLSGEGVWQSLKKTQRMAKEATIPHEAQWSVPSGFSVADFVPPTAAHITLGYTMRSADTRTPLEMRFSSEANGYGIQAFASGASGQLDLMLAGSMLYVSVAHPNVEWTVSVMGWEDNI